MNNYLETIISLIFIFFLGSTICYVIQEIFAVNFQYRGKVMWNSFSMLFDGVAQKGRAFLKQPVSMLPKSLNTTAFYAHAQISSLMKDNVTLPSYIPAANFALAVLDTVAKKDPAFTTGSGEITIQNIRSGLAGFVASKGDIFVVLKNLADTSTDINELQKKLEAWFNQYMDRVTGWYKSHTLLSTRLIALGVTLFFNINVISLAIDIYGNSDLRTSLVAMAEKAVDNPQLYQQYVKNLEVRSAIVEKAMEDSLAAATDDNARARIRNKMDKESQDSAISFVKNKAAIVQQLSRELTTSGIPLGWKKSFFGDLQGKDGAATFWNVLLLLLGWAIATGCISMGAPFWFDLLGKLINLRRAGIKPDDNTSK